MRTSLFVLTTAFALAAMPALAGPSETAFLDKLPGTWTGSGALTGGESGAVDCTLQLSGGAKINFRGTCNAGQFGPQTYSGVLTYDETARQYEARSNGQTVVGVKSGGSVVFTSKMHTIGGDGNSVMRVAANSIVIDVDLVRADTGEKLKTHIVFKK